MRAATAIAIATTATAIMMMPDGVIMARPIALS